jgi:large subunit ribosomal protein L22
MAKQKYSVKNLKENQAKAIAKDASVSTKSSIEAVKFLKGKTTKVAIAYLEKVLKKTLAIPFTRYTNGLGHRKGNGITSGRYPQKLSKALILLIKGAEANASMKGLGEDLKIVNFVANRASVPMHYGRHPRREMKRTHIEIIIEEVESTKKKVTPKKQKVAEKSKVVKTEATKKVEEKKPVEKPVEVKAPVKVIEEKKIPKSESINVKKEIKQEDKR